MQESEATGIKTMSGQQNDKTNYDKEEKLSYNTSQKNEIKKSFNDYILFFLSLIFIVFGLLWGWRRLKMNLK